MRYRQSAIGVALVCFATFAAPACTDEPSAPSSIVQWTDNQMPRSEKTTAVLFHYPDRDMLDIRASAGEVGELGRLSVIVNAVPRLATDEYRCDYETPLSPGVVSYGFSVVNQRVPAAECVITIRQLPDMDTNVEGSFTATVEINGETHRLEGRFNLPTTIQM